MTNETNTDFHITVEQHEGFFNLNRVRFLVYGESGVGKTVFSSTWKKAIFLDANHGMSSVTAKVGKIRIDSWGDLLNALQYLKSAEHDFETVVVDSLNDIQFFCLRNIIHAFPTIRRPYDDLASQSDYGKMLSDFEKFIRNITSLSMNVVLTCNVAPREYETDAVQPQLVGKHTARNVAGLMDVIGYLHKQESAQGGDKKDRIMVFDAVNYVTKDRSGMLPSRIINPTHKQLLNEWNRQFEEIE